MTHLPLLVLLGLVGKDGDLLCLAVLQDLSANSSLGTILAYLQPVVGAYCKYGVKGDLGVCLGVQLLDIKHIALRHLVLFTAGNNNCVHLSFSFT